MSQVNTYSVTNVSLQDPGYIILPVNRYTLESRNDSKQGVEVVQFIKLFANFDEM
jgi:hypothetical protein